MKSGTAFSGFRQSSSGVRHETRATSDIEAAYIWKAELLSQLSAQARIHEALARSCRQERADLQKLEARDLLMRFAWERPDEVERVMRAKRAYEEEIESLFVTAIAAGTW